MRGVAPGEAPFDAGMTVVCAAVAVGRHAYDLGVGALAAHLRREAAADAAVSAGGLLGALRRSESDQRFLGERRGRTGFHARAAGNALRLEEGLVLAGRHLGGEAAALDGEREGALGLIARAHAARADDAEIRVEREIGIALVLRLPEMALAVGVGRRLDAERPRHGVELRAR